MAGPHKQMNRSANQRTTLATQHKLGKIRVWPTQVAAKALPVKPGPRISLAFGGNVLMADQTLNRIAPADRFEQAPQAHILSRLESQTLQAFELDANGEIIAVAASCPSRSTRMPSATATRHKLNKLTITPDQKVSRHLQALKRLKFNMCQRVQAIVEQVVDMGAPIDPCGQADRMQNNHVDRHALGTGPVIGGGAVVRMRPPSLVPDSAAHGLGRRQGAKPRSEPISGASSPPTATLSRAIR